MLTGVNGLVTDQATAPPHSPPPPATHTHLAMLFLLPIYEFRALPNSGDPKDTGQRDPPAQAQRGLIFPHGIVLGSLTSSGYLSLPVSSKPHASMGWDGMGAGEGKGGRGWF